MGGVINVTFEDITVNHQTAGIHIKSQTGRGGVIQNITYRNIHLKSVRQCILVGIGGRPTNETGIPVASGIVFENVRCDAASTSSYDIAGINSSYPIRGVRFRNVTMAPGVAKQASCRSVECTCDRLTQPCPSCCKPE